MNDVAILAASYLGPAGYGNDLTGLRAWPAPLGAAFHQGDLAELHWSLLFASRGVCRLVRPLRPGFLPVRDPGGGPRW